MCFALYSASLAMTKTYKPLLRALALTYPQYLVMVTLWERDGLSVNEIGAALYLDSGTLTPLLKKLEVAGHVSRLRSVSDERRVVVRLTAQGRQLRKKALQLPIEIASRTRCDLGELQALNAQLQKLRSALLSA
jgi:MarR family transcriptional regulator, organic hydroperoxide resistance regulator